MADDTTKGGSVDKDEEKILRGLDCYHGFLPREELALLLRNEGDYLIRVSEVDQGKSTEAMSREVIKPCREIVVSVKATQDGVDSQIQSVMGDTPTKEGPPDLKATVKVKNLIIRRAKGKYLLEPHREFDTIGEVVDHYQKVTGTINRVTFQLKQPILRQKWEFQHSDLTLGKLLGQGAFGDVRQGTLIRKGKKLDVAVKLTKGSGDLCKAKIKEMMKEARIMRELRHQNVVRLYGVAVDEQPLYIILELVKGGGLNTYLTDHAGKIGQKEKLSMCLGAASGVEYIHQRKCIHMDLAARNCLYTTEKTIKISDFGLSRSGTTSYSLKPGTPCKFPIKWLAPETIETLSFSTKTDVYSYGNILYEIYTDGKEPWEALTNAEVKRSLVEGKSNTMPSECPERLRTFVKENIFVKDPSKRATMAEVAKFLEDLKGKMSDASAYSNVMEVKDDEKNNEKKEEKKPSQRLKTGSVRRNNRDKDDSGSKKKKKRKGFHGRHTEKDDSKRR